MWTCRAAVLVNCGWMEFGRFGLGDPTPDVHLDVVGSIHYTGVIVDVSDMRLKENISPLSHSLEKIKSLNGFTYNLIGEEMRTAGVSAQEVQKVLPEAVSEIDDGYIGVDYTQLIPLLIEAMKEQQVKIERLEASNNRLTALEKELGELKRLVGTASVGVAGEEE